MPQRTLPTAVEVFYKLRTQRMQEVRLGTTLSEPGEDSDSLLSGVQNESEFGVDFDPADEKYDLFYRSVNENKVGNVVAIKRTNIRSTLSGALNATTESFNIIAPPNIASFSVGTLIEIEDELMVLLTWDTGTGAATVEERGAHGTKAVSHADTTEVSRMFYTVPHNSIVLSGNLDDILPFAPAKFVLSDVVGDIGNGISMFIGLPTSQIKTLFRVHIQTSTVLWPEDFENLTGTIGIRASGNDGAIVQGGTSLTTSVTLDTGWDGKLIHTNESINLSTGEASAPDILKIDSVVDNGDGTWTVNVIGDNVYNLRRGVVGTAGIVNWVIMDEFRSPGNPSTWVEQAKPYFNQGAGLGDPDVVDVNHILRTAATVFARCRLRNFEGYGPWMYWDGTLGSTVIANAVTFTPVRMLGGALAFGAVTADKQSKGTIPATVNINMVPVDEDTVSWSSGSVSWADGATETIDQAGSPKTLAPGVTYVYKLTGTPALQFTIIFSNAIGNDRTYLGQIIVASPPVAGEFATIFLFGDISGPVFTSAVGAFGKLSALTADLGEVTAGIVTGVLIRTAANGERLELTSADSIDFYNSGDLQIGFIDIVASDMQIRTTLAGSQILIESISDLRLLSNSVEYIRLSRSRLEVMVSQDINMQGLPIGNVGDLEVTSITKRGSGNIILNDGINPAFNDTYEIGTTSLAWSNVNSFRYRLQEKSAPGTPPANQCVLYLGSDDDFKIKFDNGRTHIIAPKAVPGIYTPTNVITDRSYNANSTSVAELADVLGTLIADLQSLAWIG